MVLSCPKGILLLRDVWAVKKFSHLSFVVGHFPQSFWYNCSSLRALDVGMVGHSPSPLANENGLGELNANLQRRWIGIGHSIWVDELPSMSMTIYSLCSPWSRFVAELGFRTEAEAWVVCAEPKPKPKLHGLSSQTGSRSQNNRNPFCDLGNCFITTWVHVLLSASSRSKLRNPVIITAYHAALSQAITSRPSLLAFCG